MPRDPNQRAFLTVQMALGEVEQTVPLPTKAPERVERGKLGGAKGGKLRAERLSPERRREIAQKAAAARWGPK
jgi:hypothetical protein